MTGHIFDIQRFCVHDGPGIRTTVFFKGCPLRCIWCHNPESQSSAVSIAYYAHKCISCGACVNTCTRGCHSLPQADIPETRHRFDRQNCVKCGACAAACPNAALEKLGRRMTAEEILCTVERDRIFYRNSGGGLTVSGGEPLMQSAFLLTLLQMAKERGISTCIETCGYARSDVIRSILPYTDLVLFDVKETDSVRHKALTGVPLEPILENLRLIDALGTKIILRLPLVPGKNLRDDHLARVARIAADLTGLLEINIMAYHTLGSSKYEALNMEDEMRGATAMQETEKEEAIAVLNRYLSQNGKHVPVK